MILDSLVFLSGSVLPSGAFSGQAVNGAGTILSANTMDMASLSLGGNQVSDTGRGRQVNFGITVITAPTVGATVKFQLIQADDSALTTNVQVINSTDDIPIASLPAGTLVPMMLDQAVPYTAKRYLGLRYINTGAIATASYVAGFLRDVQDVKGAIFKTGFAML